MLKKLLLIPLAVGAALLVRLGIKKANEESATLVSNAPVQAPLDKTLAFMQDHFSEADLSLTIIAEAAGCSEEELVQLFSDEKNSTVEASLLALRIKAAKKLLKASSDPLGVVAEKVGLDAKKFSALFKKETSTAPSIFRKA